MANSKEVGISLDQLQERLSPLRRELENIDEAKIIKISRELRARMLRTPEQKDKDPKELGLNMELIDSGVTPILLAVSYIAHDDKNLSRLLLQGSQRSQREKLLEIVGKCLEKICQGQELNLAGVRTATEEVAFQVKSSVFVKNQIERLKNQGKL